MTWISVPAVIAHRGASGYAPENTLASFYRAKELGAEWVEFDIMLTRCGELVVIHGPDLERTTNGTGRVQDVCYDDLKQLDAGSWFSPDYRNHRIPLLAEVVDCLSECGLGANFELKVVAGQEHSVATKTVDFINKHWPTTLPSPVLSSFSFKCLQAIQQYDPRQQLAVLLYYRWGAWQKQCAAVNAVSLHVRCSMLTAAKVAAVKATRCVLLTYVVNEVEQARQLFDWGVDGVFTDYPDRILQVC